MMQRVRRSAGSFRQRLKIVVLFVVTLWGVFFLDLLIRSISPLADLPFLPLNEHWGLIPRYPSGFVGILTMPFLHGSFRHLFSNTLPLLVLLSLLASVQVAWYRVVAGIWLLGGGLLWIAGTNGTSMQVKSHIGASLLIFGLITFLITSGLVQRRPVSIAIALLVAFLYGLPLLIGVLPIPWAGVSWDGHLCGAIAGVIVACLMYQSPQRRHAKRSQNKRRRTAA